MLGESLGYTYGKVLSSYEGIKLGSTYGKLVIAILGNVYGITLGIDVVKEMESLYGSSGGSNNNKLDWFISCRLTWGLLMVKCLALINASDWDLMMVKCTLDGSFDSSNDIKIEVLLIGYSLVSNYGKVLGCAEGIKLGSTYSKFIVTVLTRIYLW